MDQTEQLLTLIGCIYEAALDSTLWTDVLPRIAKFVGGPTSALLSNPPRVGAGPALQHSEPHIHLAPKSRPPLFDVDGSVSDLDLTSAEELRGSYFDRWRRGHQDFDDDADESSEKSTSSFTHHVTGSETQAVPDTEERRRLSLIEPHLHRALRIGEMVDLKHSKAAA